MRMEPQHTDCCSILHLPPEGGDLHTKIVSPMCGKISWIQGQYVEQDVDPRLPRLGYIFNMSSEYRVNSKKFTGRQNLRL